MSFKNFGPEAMAASWDIYAFEANPEFDKILDETRKQVSLKHKVNLYNQTAAWTYDGTIDFYLDTVNQNNHFWGSSLNKNHPDVVRSGSVKVSVKCMDIAGIIKQYKLDDLVVIKMDIEGAEYDLLLDFIKKDVLQLVDFMAIEFHPKYTKHKTAENFLIDLMNVTGVKYFEWK